ncbi:MAG: hypothetical protein KDK91_29075 [Gammaproteobacteria bacterium]|nr:hypothetical protein [Gammaproteobacteria bacterium]
MTQRMGGMTRALCIMILGVLAAPASAIVAVPMPATWHIEATLSPFGGDLNDAVVSGSFDYDPNAPDLAGERFSNLSITVSILTDFVPFLSEDRDLEARMDGLFFDDSNIVYDQVGSQLSLTNGAEILLIEFDDVLDPLFSPFMPTSLSFLGVCDDASCNTASADWELTSGQVSAVPVPAAAWLFASALLGGGLLRRRVRPSA